MILMEVKKVENENIANSVCNQKQYSVCGYIDTDDVAFFSIDSYACPFV